MSVAAAATTARLGARDLEHRYGARRGLKPVSFDLEGPGLVAVTGANGAGKSTLLKILAGLLRPSGGTSTLVLDGRERVRAGRRRVVGYAGPEIRFYGELGVAENLRFAADARALAAPAAAVTRALERTGLGARAADRVDALSSGMEQRLRLAFALLHEPEVLLLDEPGSHLDEPGRRNLERLIAGESRDRLVVIATNEPREWELATRRIELAGGLGDPA